VLSLNSTIPLQNPEMLQSEVTQFRPLRGPAQDAEGVFNPHPPENTQTQCSNVRRQTTRHLVCAGGTHVLGNFSQQLRRARAVNEHRAVPVIIQNTQSDGSVASATALKTSTRRTGSVLPGAREVRIVRAARCLNSDKSAVELR
jgi:hypothetical protein